MGDRETSAEEALSASGSAAVADDVCFAGDDFELLRGGHEQRLLRLLDEERLQLVELCGLQEAFRVFERRDLGLAHLKLVLQPVVMQVKLEVVHRSDDPRPIERHIVYPACVELVLSVLGDGDDRNRIEFPGDYFFAGFVERSEQIFPPIS